MSPIPKRLLSITGGLLVGLLILEVLLRGGGAVVSARDQQRAGDEALGAWRVLCLGACYTIGLGSAPSESYPARLQDQLRTAHDGASVSVINGGIRSKSVDYFADRIDGLIELFSPRVIVVNINDRMAYDADELARALSQQHTPVQDLLGELRVVRLVQLARSGPPRHNAMEDEGWWQKLAAEEQQALDPYAWRIQMVEQKSRMRPRDQMLQDRLAALYIERSDFAAALEVFERSTPRQGEVPYRSLEMFKCSAALGHYEDAAAHLSRAAAPAHIASLQSALGKTPTPAEGEDAANQHHLDVAILAILTGDDAQAASTLEQLLSRDPDFASAYPLLDFVRWRQGEDVLSAADAFAARPQRAVRTQNGFGLVSEDSDEVLADEEAARRFAALLDLHLTTIRQTADEQGITVILENLSTLPFQQAIIEDLADQHGLTLVDLQGGLLRHPDRDALFHDTQHLRLSAAGNAWVAEQIFAALEAEGVAPEVQ